MNYLVYGNERYLLQEKLNQIINEHVGKQDQMNTVFYDAGNNDFTMRTVLEEASTFPFFSEHKVIVVSNSLFLTRGTALSDADLKSLDEYLIKPSDFASIVFYHEEENLDTNKKVVKSIQKYCRVMHVKKSTGEEFRGFIRNEAAKRKMKLSHDAFNELILRVDENMTTGINELEKLSLYSLNINFDDVVALVSRPLDNQVFHLVNALMDKDLRRSMKIWNDMVVLSIEPLSFVGLIASQLRLMYQVLTLHQQGYHRNEIVNMLSSASGNINAYRVSRVLVQAEATTPERLLFVLNRLAELDQKSKSGQIEKKFGFEMFLIEATR